MTIRTAAWSKPPFALIVAIWLATLVGAAALAVTSIALVGIYVMAIVAADAVAFASMGALIVRRQPTNRLGWLLAVAGPSMVLTFLGYLVGAVRFAEAGPDDPLGRLFAWVGANAFWPTFLLFGTIGLLFPDGRLPSPRWRPAIRATLVVLGFCLVVVAVAPGPVGEGLGDNPFGIDQPVVAELARIANPVALLSTLLIVVFAAVGVALRFRRARGIARQQLKWFLAAVALFAALLPLSFIDTEFMAEVNGFTPFDVTAMSSIALIPMAVAIAILRYRLYAIDRLISRTVGWASASVVLAGVFVVGLVVLQALLAGITQADTIAVAASTLLAAALFQPVRRRIQAAVDRRFDRVSYDSERVVAAFAGRLRNELDLDALIEDVGRVASATVRPSSTAIWLRVRREAPR